MKSKLITELALAAAVACAAVGGARADQFYFTVDGVTSSGGNALSSDNPYLAYFFATDYSTKVAGSYTINHPKTTLAEIENLLANSDASVRAKTIANMTKTTATGTYDADSGTASFSGWLENNFTQGSWISGFAIVFDAASVEEASRYMVAKTSDGGTTVKRTGTKTTIQEGTYTTYQYLAFGNQSENGAVWQTIPDVSDVRAATARQGGTESHF